MSSEPDYVAKMKEITDLYFDMAPPMTRGHDHWAVRLGVKDEEDACTCIGNTASPMISAMDVLPNSNFVFRAGDIPNLLNMLGKIMMAQQERDQLHYDKMSTYREDD